jgi:hypothetical protein
MEESRRILARSQELLRRIHQKESSATDAGDGNLMHPIILKRHRCGTMAINPN